MVGSCPAQLPPPHRAINPTDSNGRCVAFCDLPDSRMAFSAVYIICQKHRAQTGTGPKKDPRPVWSSLGLRTGPGPVLTLDVT